MKNKIISYAGWTLVWCLIFYFIYSNALRYFNPGFPRYTKEFSSFAPFLVTHISGGIIALLLGPFQFSSSIRLKFPHVHRTTGKVYLVAVLISALTATYLSIFDNILTHNNFIFGTGVFFLAMAWLITGGMAYFAIRNKNILQHREWMTRCYVVTFGFVTFRIIYDTLTGIEQFPFKKEMGGVAAWACWSIPLLITEWILQVKKVKNRTSKKEISLS